MTGMAALAFCAAFTSCSKEITPMSEEEKAAIAVEKIYSNYEAAFQKVFGTPVAGHTWGFSDAASTRSVIKQDMTDYPSATAPAAITTKEAAWVTDWFQKNPGLTEVGQPFTNFYVQFVSGDQNNKKGIWHRYDQNRVNNGYDSNYWDEEFTDNGGMDKLHCGATRSQSATDHLNDFNAKTGGPWDVVYIKNGSALQWGYHSSWGEDSKAPDGDGYYWYFKMVELTVPGDCFADGVARKGWYVGLSLYGKKYDNGDKELGYQRLQYAEDWILKVVPGDPEPPVTADLRVMAEDLSAGEDGKDFDFNDVVFDVYYGDASTAKVTILAAGGLLPLRVNNVDVHSLLGYSGKMINTNGTLSNDEYVRSQSVDNVPTKDIPLGFAVNSATEVRDLIKIEVYKEQDGTTQWVPLNNTGKAACKIAVDPKTRIANERENVNDVLNMNKWVVEGGTPEIVNP